jgi:hypothetical protein
MAIVSRWRRRLAGALCAVCLAGTANADTLLDTGTPGGWLGYYGFDVFVGQSVAVAFTPGQNYAFDDVSLWLMSNDFDADGRMLTISLQTDAGGGPVPVAPSGTALESWAHATGAIGWTPVLETLSSILHPLLTAGTTYWIVAESNEPAFVDPIWVAAGNGPAYTMGNIDFASGPGWQVGLTSGPPGLVITATAVPEPAALVLALLGVPLVLRAAKRRSKAMAQA